MMSSLFGQLISTVLSNEGAEDRVYTYREEGWVSENVYGTFDSSDRETPEVTFTFHEDGSLLLQKTEPETAAWIMCNLA